MNTLILIISFFVATQSFADGNRVGNGGMGIICKTKPTATLLDFYEGDYVPSGAGDANSILKVRFASLKKLDPKRSEIFLKRAEEIRPEFEFRSGVKLSSTGDSAHLFVPKAKNCRLSQLIIRRENPSSGVKRFLVDQELWNQLSTENQAGLIAHEVIYEYFFKLGEGDSRHARQYNLKLFNGELAAMNPDQYWKWIQEMKIPFYPN